MDHCKQRWLPLQTTCFSAADGRVPLNARPSHFLQSLRIVALIAKLAFARETLISVTFPGFWPIFATATWVFFLELLALLTAPRELAVCAQMRFAYGNIKTRLSLACFKL